MQRYLVAGVLSEQPKSIDKHAFLLRRYGFYEMQDNPSLWGATRSQPVRIPLLSVNHIVASVRTLQRC